MAVKGYSVSSPYTLNLPISMSANGNFYGYCCSRDIWEVHHGLSIVNKATLQFRLSNFSSQSRTIYSLMWLVVGY